MKKLFILSLVASLFIGCVVVPTTDTSETAKKISVVASFYPLYEIALRVGGDFVTVANLVPAGAEPHDYEPSPRDIIAMHEAKLVLYNGAGIEPWADKIVPDLEKKGVATLNESKNFTILHSDDEESESGQDPHIWLDPVNYQDEIGAVAQKLASIDPEHKAFYEKNAEAFKQEIRALDESYEGGLKECTHRSFVTSHAAFAYLAKRYNLTMIPIAGVSPDAEPSPRDLANLTNTIKKLGVKYILVETLLSPKIAEVLARDVGAQTVVLNPLEGLIPEEIAKGKNYVSVMTENLQSLRIALECK